MSVVKNIANDEAKLELTPMIDVTFLLLVLFLATLQFKTLDGKLAAYLPKDVGASAPSDPVPALDLRIRADAAGITYSIGPRTVRSMDTLRALLKRYQAHTPNRSIAIGPGPGVDHGTTVGVLDAVLHAGFEQVRFLSPSPRTERP